MTAVRTERVVKSLVTADPEFVELCEVLFGDVDPEEIHAEVFEKRGPQQDPMSPEEVRRRRLKRISQASNIVGLTAGAAAIGSTFSDERLDPRPRDEKGKLNDPKRTKPETGPVARAVHATGRKIPKPIQRMSRNISPKAAGRMAVGAAGLQVGNVVGDLAVSQALKDPKPKKAGVSKTLGEQLARAKQTPPPPTAAPLPEQRTRVGAPKHAGRGRHAGGTSLRGMFRTTGRHKSNGTPSAASRVSGYKATGVPKAPSTSSRIATARSRPKPPPAVGPRPTRPRRTTSNAPAPAAVAPAVTPAAPKPAKAPRQGLLQRTRGAMANRKARRFDRKNPPIARQIHEINNGALKQTAHVPKHEALADSNADKWRNAGKTITKPKNLAIGGGLLATGALLGGRKQPQYDPYVYKAEPELKIEGEFSKFDEDKRVAFGWASVVEKDGIPVIDRQGDYIAAEDMEKAAYEYVLKSRKGGDMHRRITSELGEDAPHHVADLIESVVFTKEKIAKMGLPSDFPVGWWIGMKVHDDETWQLVKKGERKGFSIHGKGKRVEKSIDELVEY